MPWSTVGNIKGPSGSNAYTTVTTAFTTPAVGSTVTVTVADTDWAGIGQPVYIEGAGGILIVQAKTATTLTLLNP